MSETNEILQTVDQLHGLLGDLIVRGLRSTTEAQWTPLAALRDEFDRIGAGHLAGRIQALLDAVRQDDPSAAAALLRAQTSLRLFERILTLECASELLQGTLANEEEE